MQARAPWLRASAVAVLLAVSIAACGGASSSQGSASPGRSLSGKKLVYIGGQVGDPNYKAVGCGAKAEAERLGGKLSQQDAKSFAPADQIPVVNSAAAGQPDGMLISPTDPHALHAPLKVINADRPVETVVNALDDTSSINGQILVDNYGGGKLGADHLAKLAEGKPAEIGAFSFQPGGSKAADDELKGFEAELRKYPNLTYIGPQFQGPDAQVTDAASKMNAVLTAHPNLLGMFATYGFAAEGILTSAAQRNAAFHLVAAYSATTPQLVTALRNGNLSAIVDYPFRQAGAAAVDQLAAKLDQHPVRKTVSFPAAIYTSSSFSDPAQAKNLGPASC